MKEGLSDRQIVDISGCKDQFTFFPILVLSMNRKYIRKHDSGSLKQFSGKESVLILYLAGNL